MSFLCSMVRIRFSRSLLPWGNTVMIQKIVERERDFSRLYSESFDYVYSFIFSRTAGDRLLTEEIVQDTFTAAWLSLERFCGTSSFQTWVCSIAKNKLRESYRKAIRRERREVLLHDETVEPVDDYCLEETILNRETGAEVLRALRKLNPSYRYALILKYVDGYSIKEIAAIMARSQKAIDGILQRAKVAFGAAYQQSERERK